MEGRMTVHKSIQIKWAVNIKFAEMRQGNGG